MSSGSVVARHTRCAGASNSRSITISVSLGSVTVALPLCVMVSILRFLLLELFEHLFQPVEPLVPRVLVTLDPVVDRLEPPSVQPVDPLAAGVAYVDETHLAEDPQVLRHLGLTEPEPLDEVVHRPLALGEGIQDLPPPGFGHRVERVRRRRCSCHVVEVTYPYGYTSTPAVGVESECGRTSADLSHE